MSGPNHVILDLPLVETEGEMLVGPKRILEMDSQ